MSGGSKFPDLRIASRVPLLSLTPPMSVADRLKRLERIKANIAAMPGKSYCYPEEKR